MRTGHFTKMSVACLLLAWFLTGCAGRTTPPAIPTQPPSAITTSAPSAEVRPELGQYFQGYTGAFVLYDRNANRYIRYNPERCAEQFLPASTFKILNALIGLETGVIPDENFVIKWDGRHYDIPAWNQDHSLKTALQNSVVWYFQELARRVGAQSMRQYVEAAGYGNKDISGQIDSFWLDGALRISADEQVEFLKRFYQNDLPFSQRSLTIVKTLLVLEKADSYQLSGKTGSVQRVNIHTGWFVGYLETDGNLYFFATNLESSDPNGLANGQLAQKINRNILQSLALLPAQP
jgi:beta-lactamase class D